MAPAADDEMTKYERGELTWREVLIVSAYALRAIVMSGGLAIVCYASYYCYLTYDTALDSRFHQLEYHRTGGYDHPGVLVLGEGMYTFQCVSGRSRLRPDSRPGDFAGRDLETPEGRVVCNTTEYIEFRESLESFGQSAGNISTLPKWLQANLATSVSNRAAGCESFRAEFPEGAPASSSSRREKRSAVDDLDRCDGPCARLWECANSPQVCEADHSFKICFVQEHHTMAHLEPCLSYRACLAGPPRLPDACGYHLACLTQDNIYETWCVAQLECMLRGTKEGVCKDVFQCIEDQIEGKCELHTTQQPHSLDLAQVDEACDAIDDIVSQQHPSLRDQTNQPLSLVLMKGPSEYKDRNFLFSSMRVRGDAKGVQFAIHPNYNQALEMWRTLDKYTLLNQLFADLRWNLLSRGFRTYCFMSQSIMKLENVVQDVRIRLEMSVSRLNLSNPIEADYRPAELYIQWKDGYVIEGNRYIGVSAWDAVTFVAATLLMLERAWTTWGRVMNKLVDAHAQRVMRQYEVGSPQWVIFHQRLSKDENVVESLMALRSLKAEEKKQARLERRRKLEEKRRKEREDKRRHKIERAKALKFGTISDEVLDWEEKRRMEWEVYRSMLKQDVEKNRKFLNEMSEKERLEYLEEQERLRKQFEKKAARRYKRRNRSADTSRSQSSVSRFTDTSEEDGGGGSFNFDGGEARMVKSIEVQQELKQKRTRKVNAAFTAPEHDFNVTPSPEPKTFLPWARKKAESRYQ